MAYKFAVGESILSGAITPMVDGTYDLGASAVEWKDAFFDGTVYTDALGSDTNPVGLAFVSGGEIDGVDLGKEAACLSVRVSGSGAININLSGAVGTMDQVIIGGGYAGGAAGTFSTLTATTFKMPINTAGYLLVGDANDYEEVALSGDATLASGGALTIGNLAVSTAKIADNAVTLAKMDALARGSIIYGDASGDPANLAKGAASTFLQSNGTDVAYVALSGDATLSAGAITIADNAVTLAKMAGLASANFILGNGSGDPAAATMSGDTTMTNAGVTSIGATKVTDAMLNDSVATGLAGVGLGAASGVMVLDLNELSAGAVDVALDSIAIVDANDSNVSKKESISDLVTAMAGAGLTATNGVLSSDASPTPNGIANADATLAQGFNYGTTTFNAARTWTTPNTADLGDVITVKAPLLLAGFGLTIEGYDANTIDGAPRQVIASDGGAVTLTYVLSGSWRIS